MDLAQVAETTNVTTTSLYCDIFRLILDLLRITSYKWPRTLPPADAGALGVVRRGELPAVLSLDAGALGVVRRGELPAVLSLEKRDLSISLLGLAWSVAIWDAPSLK